MRIPPLTAYLFGAFSHESVLVAPSPSLDVHLSSGTFRGVANLNGTEAWLGIPFAQPPVGPLRFKAPLPITEPLQGIQDASQYGDVCPQPPSPLTRPNDPMSENCLTLNVWRPMGTSADARLPVLVWFFGGAYNIGSTTNSEPYELIKWSVTVGKPIVFAAMNYRLNTFGFLASADVPPEDLNAGLLDQQAALKFIQENIGRFGGDPSKVTIGGVSAGAGSVEAQMLYGTEPGLFRAVIAHSSAGPFKNAPYAWQYDKSGMPYSYLLRMTGCTAGPGSVQCLRQVPYETLLNITSAMLNTSLNDQLWEPAVGPVGSFVPERPSQRILSGNYTHVSYLGGDTLNDGTIYSKRMYNLSLSPSEQVSAFNSWVPRSLVDASTLTSDVMTGIEKLFPPNDSMYGGPWHTGDLLYDRAAAWYTDMYFVAARRFLFEHGASLQPMWGYRFAEFSPGTPPALGVFHASDLGFIFGPVPRVTQNEFADKMKEYWINFIYDMNPGLDWPQYNTTSKYVMQLMRGNITLIPDDFDIARTDYLNSPAVLVAFGK